MHVVREMHSRLSQGVNTRNVILLAREAFRKKRKMQFDPFIIPFNVGLYFILIYAVVRSIIWFRALSRSDKLRLQRGFFGRAFGQSIKEIFLESLIHKNPENKLQARLYAYEPCIRLVPAYPIRYHRS